MTEVRDEKLISIGQAAVLLSREFPGVSVSSLRFLQREGLISPQLSPGGHRLYSAGDLERIRVIKQWQAERVSLKEIRHRLENFPSLQPMDELVGTITDHLLAANIEGALEELETLDSAGTPLLTICEEVLTPVLRNLGDDEGNHLIPVDLQFELDERLIRFLANATNVPPVRQAHPVVVAACPTWERHDMPLRMLCALLAERGLSVHFMGALVDRNFVLDASRRLNSDLILVSLTVPPVGSEVKQWFTEVIAGLSPNQELYIGGSGAASLAELASGNVKIIGTESYPETLDRVMNPGASFSR